MNEIDLKELNVSHHFGGGVYAKETRIPAGYVMVQHKHRYEHLSLLASGIAEIGAVLREGPFVMVVPAECYHRVRAVTDCVWYCIHATEERDPTKVDQVLVSPATSTAEAALIAQR